MRDEFCLLSLILKKRNEYEQFAINPVYLLILKIQKLLKIMTKETTNWPDLAIGLYERLTGRNAEITYEFDNFELEVPSKAGENADHASWRMNGVLRISTSEQE